jgi:hypothetical protein
VGPQIQILRDKLGALIDPDRRRKAHFPTNPFEHLDIDAAEREARLQRRREA